ncbi:MAG: DNA recombination protein RmuC [Betaproteobacteria bacterium]|nr:DNA recombination protein RmuC [Betaproteobacteria bacterium]
MGLLARSRYQSSYQQIQAEAQLEAATLNERLIAIQRQTDELGRSHVRLQAEAKIWRDELDKARDENARLGERTSRVSSLETRLREMEGQAKSMQEQMLQVSQEKAAASQSLEASRREASDLAARLGKTGESLELIQRDNANMREAQGKTFSELKSLQEQHASAQAILEETLRAKDDLQRINAGQQGQLAAITTSLEAERQQAQEKLALLQEAREQLSLQFKNLASEILEEKSKRFTEQNQVNLEQLLHPLRTQLHEFKGKVEEVYVQEGKDRSALAEQVKSLMTLNQQLSKDAHNLTNALKGQAKTQGNWGEMILEKVLGSSGLRRGFEYDVQESHSREDGSRVQPDVVIHLPEERHLIVDAKVSLNAYEDYSNADSDALREAALRRHLESVRNHIRGLSEKRYEALYGLKSLDFVLMFVPIEPAFMLAIANDGALWQDAWTKNVLLVSPSTLLFVVRTVAHLWRQEQQSRNAQEIAKRGGELYDKLVGFVEDMENLGIKLNQAQKAYELATGKFSLGKGNVIRQAEMLKELGVKPSKALPSKLLEVAIEDHRKDTVTNEPTDTP